MSRTATLAAMGHGVSLVGHHVHHVRVDRAYPHQAARPVEPVAATADCADVDSAGAVARTSTLDLLLFSFAVGSGWGPAQSWRLTAHDAGKRQAPVY